MPQSVLLAMSGGIDSSVCAVVLQEQGFDIQGLTYRTHDTLPSETYPSTVKDAKELAVKLGIKHYVIDYRDEFRNTVIENFISEYLRGRTPNPCVYCNETMKWGNLLKQANILDCEKIATGHYARIRYDNGRYVIFKGTDTAKDQSYFLWRLSQENLARTVFPLGEFTKSKVRDIAMQKGLTELIPKKESQEICFIDDNDYRRFLKEIEPEKTAKIGCGNYILPNGKIVGQHQGYPFYTIGQRKGLGIALGEPYFVTNIDIEKNQITIGRKEDLKVRAIQLTDVRTIKYETIPAEGLNVHVKIRYRNKPESAFIYNNKNGIVVEFENVESAVTPGQSAVFYEGDDVVGGGIIDAVFK